MKNKDNIVKNVLTNSAAKGIVSQTDFFEKQIANSDNTSGYYIIKNGYFVYNPRISVLAPCGPFNKYYGKKDGIMSPLYTVYKYKDASEYYSEFLSLYFSGSSWYSYMNSIANYGARSDRMNVTSADMDNMPFPYPPLAEQEKIVKILSVQDRIIELYQRKIEELQKMKNIYLSKMFPKKGENAPEWRFSQFNDSWEQRKLGEVIRLNGRIGFRGYTEKDIVSKDDGGVLTFSPTNIVDNKLTTNCKNTYITRFKYDESPEIKIHNGDILFVKTGSTLGKSALVTGLSEDATLNPQVVVMRTNNLNVEFLAAMLVTNSIISQVNSAKIGGAVPTLTETRIKDFDVAIPVSEAEKEQIGLFFSQLDNLITLHQRKLEENKKYKNALMQLLLTGIVRCK